MNEKLKELKQALDEVGKIDKNNITEEQFIIILENFNKKMVEALPEINKLTAPEAQMFKFLCNLYDNIVREQQKDVQIKYLKESLQSTEEYAKNLDKLFGKHIKNSKELSKTYTKDLKKIKRLINENKLKQAQRYIDNILNE